MGTEQLDSGQQAAPAKFAEAQRAYERRRLDQAVHLAQEALEIDQTYNKARHWLAERYLEMDQLRKASHEYQDILHQDRGDQKAWECLEEIDPASATRLRRLSEIAPDPFVARRQATADMNAFESLEEGVTSGEEPMVEGGQPWRGGGEQAEELAELVAEVAPVAAPPAWEYEQDREYLDRWLAEPVVQHITTAVQQIASEADVFAPLLSQCQPADEQHHAQIIAAVGRAAQRLDIQPPQLYIVSQPALHPCLLTDTPAILVVPAALAQVTEEPELLFLIGRELAGVRSGYLAAWQAVAIITERPTEAEDCAETVRQVLAERLEPGDADITPQGKGRLKKLGHAWQQRAALSADRAGLLCCQDIHAAGTAIAKGTMKNAEAASGVTLEQFMDQFAGQEASELAAIPVEERPWCSPAYGAYRIQMLQWWARTAEYQTLRV